MTAKILPFPSRKRVKVTPLTWGLSDTQLQFFDCDAFATLYIGGWGSGKTWIGARKAYLNSKNYPGSLGLIAANTIKQLHQSTLVEFWATLRNEFGLVQGRDYVYNERPPKAWNMESRFADHNCVITFRWGAQIVTRSLSNHEQILGLTLGWAWIDEARDAKREAFDTVLSRLRCNKIPKPRVDITTSPNGFDWLYEYFEAQPGDNPALKTQRQYFVASTLDNQDNLPDDFVQGLLSSLDENLAKQNIHGEWIDISCGQAYYKFSRKAHVTDSVAFNPTCPVFLCCDFNATPMSWVVAQPYKGGQHAMPATAAFSRCPPKHQHAREFLAVIDEIVIRDSSTPEAINEFIDRGYAPHPHLVQVYGDSSGHHTTVIQSDYSIISQAGFRNIHTKKHNPPVIDRVNAVNSLLANSKGEAGILIHPRCKELIRDLSQVGFKPGTRQLDKSDPDRTHTSDALGYCIVERWPIHRAKTIRTKGTRF